MGQACGCHENIRVYGEIQGKAKFLAQLQGPLSVRDISALVGGVLYSEKEMLLPAEQIIWGPSKLLRKGIHRGKHKCTFCEGKFRTSQKLRQHKWICEIYLTTPSRSP